MSEHLITGSGPLLDEEGRLREPGYAYQPPFDYNRENIAAPAWRIKDWDYYLVEDDEYAVALTFSDMGYVGLISASVMDFEEKTFKTTSELVPAPMGSMGVPRGTDEGEILWGNKRCYVRFWHPQPGMRWLTFSMKHFNGAADLEFEVLLDREPRDSMVIATPWAEDPTAFYYNRKILGMRAQGGFRVGENFHEFKKANALGLMDAGRGVWTYENVWYWAAAQGYQNGHLVAFNLGYGFGDTSAASENMVFIDGKAQKLGRVDFGIPRRYDGTYDYLGHWHIIDNEGRLDLSFVTEIDRTDNMNVMNVVVTRQHQIFGKLNGHVILDDGSRLVVRGLRASAENIYNRY